ncbi:MAG: hypothetical protein IJZ96_09025 [Lachnospiraceae bacterium]|nr:hypothetical protein [Lachnospiraceae bacterium]
MKYLDYDESKTINNILNYLDISNIISKSHLAREMGITKSMFYNTLKYGRTLYADEFFNICLILNKKPSDFIFENEYKISELSISPKLVTNKEISELWNDIRSNKLINTPKFSCRTLGSEIYMDHNSVWNRDKNYCNPNKKPIHITVHDIWGLCVAYDIDIDNAFRFTINNY